MEKKRWTKFVKWAIEIVIALGAASWIAGFRGFAWSNPFQLNARYLSDGFFVIGLIMTGLGLLVWISTTGFFDMMSYGFRSLLVLFTSLKKPKDHMTFYDYKTARDEKRGKAQWSILVVGAACIVLSVVCVLLYYRL